jgi:RNA-binding protein
LNSEQKKFLKAKAHALKPVVITGQHGITPNLLAEIGLALDHHELIKVRVNAADRDERRAMTEEICRDSGAELVQSVGHVITLYRKNPDKA